MSRSRGSGGIRELIGVLFKVSFGWGVTALKAILPILTPTVPQVRFEKKYVFCLRHISEKTRIVHIGGGKCNPNLFFAKF